jgi:hypothetical protein
MKTNCKAALLALLITTSGAHAFGQALNLDSGYTQQSLLNVSTPTEGFDFDSSGNIYYIGGASYSAADTQVVQATAASGYTTLNPIVDYGSPENPVSTFGAFVTVHNSTVYYGDSVNGGNVNAASTTVTTPTPTPNAIANVPDNYDLVFSGTTAYVSANITGASNEVDVLNLSTGVYKTVLQTNGDNSGPIAFTPSGGLIYGGSGYNATYGSGVNNIYIFSAASLLNAVNTGIPLDLADAQTVIDNNGNSAFTVIGDQLYQAFSPFNGDSTITDYNLNTLTSTVIATVDNQGYYFSGMSAYNGNLTVAETDGYTSTDFIQINTAAVPEPGVASLGIAGCLLAGLAVRRRRTERAD